MSQVEQIVSPVAGGRPTPPRWLAMIVVFVTCAGLAALIARGHLEDRQRVEVAGPASEPQSASRSVLDEPHTAGADEAFVGGDGRGETGGGGAGDPTRPETPSPADLEAPGPNSTPPDDRYVVVGPGPRGTSAPSTRSDDPSSTSSPSTPAVSVSAGSATPEATPSPAVAPPTAASNPTAGFLFGIWGVDSVTLRHRLIAPNREVLAVSDDGSLIIVRDGTEPLEVIGSDGRVRRVLSGVRDTADLSFSPDNRRLAFRTRIAAPFVDGQDDDWTDFVSTLDLSDPAARVVEIARNRYPGFMSLGGWKTNDTVVVHRGSGSETVRFDGTGRSRSRENDLDLGERSPDGRRYVDFTDGLVRITDVDRRVLEELRPTETDAVIVHAGWTPSGRSILALTVGQNSSTKTRMEVLALDGGPHTRLGEVEVFRGFTGDGRNAVVSMGRDSNSFWRDLTLVPLDGGPRRIISTASTPCTISSFSWPVLDTGEILISSNARPLLADLAPRPVPCRPGPPGDRPRR